MKSKTETNKRSPSLSAKEALILELLLQDPCAGMYGLELVKQSGDRLKRGTVYVSLARMQDKGFIESRLEERPPGAVGLPRPLYYPTGYGQKVFQAWEMAQLAQRLHLEGTLGVT